MSFVISGTEYNSKDIPVGSILSLCQVSSPARSILPSSFPGFGFVSGSKRNHQVAVLFLREASTNDHVFLSPFPRRTGLKSKTRGREGKEETALEELVSAAPGDGDKASTHTQPEPCLSPLPERLLICSKVGAASFFPFYTLLSC